MISPCHSYHKYSYREPFIQMDALHQAESNTWLLNIPAVNQTTHNC